MSVSTNNLPHEPVSSLEANRTIDSVYCLNELQQRVKKNGDPYYSMTLADATGQLAGVMWDNVDAFLSGRVEAGHYVRVQGFLGQFKDSLQLTVQNVERIEESAVDVTAFRAVSRRPRAEMEAELDQWIARVKNPDCKRLLDYMFSNERFREKYCTAPAAARVHQAFLHGLLEHTLAVVTLATSIAKLYDPINIDLLITGALLHDIGKVRELDWSRGIGYTDQGRLLGHIYIGATMIEKAIANLEANGEKFDPQFKQLLIHLILSHHGRLEYGSPSVPKTREALVLHYADYTEAYMAAFAEDTNRFSAKGEVWTPYNKMFQSYLMTGIGTFPGMEEEPGGTDPMHLAAENRPDPIEDIVSSGEKE